MNTNKDQVPKCDKTAVISWVFANDKLPTAEENGKKFYFIE